MGAVIQVDGRSGNVAGVGGVASEGLMIQGAPTTQETASIAAPGSSATGFYQFKHATAGQATAGEPAAITTAGWVYAGLTGGPGSMPLASIAAGTWSGTMVLSSTLYLGTGAPWVRLWQASADLTSSTKITLPGADTNGWVQWGTAAALSAAGTTYTWSLASVGAVTLAATTPYLYGEFGFNITVGALAAGTIGFGIVSNPTPGQPAITVPAITYGRTGAESVTGSSDSVTRAIQVSRSVPESVTAATDAVTRIAGHTRLIAESATVASDTPSRTIHVARSIPEALTPASDAAARTAAYGRLIAETVPVSADAVTRIAGHTRSISETSVPASDAVTRIAQFNRLIPDGGGVAASDQPTRQIAVARSVAETLTPATDAVTRIAQFSRIISEVLTGAAPPPVTKAPDLIFYRGRPIVKLSDPDIYGP